MEAPLAPQPQFPGFAAIERLSDRVGILQHSRHSVPDPDHGYCLDDNARALILLHRRRDLPADLHDQWVTVFATFVAEAWNPRFRRFRNLMDYEGRWLEEVGSEDSWGRAVWSFGVTAREARSSRLRSWSAEWFGRTATHLLGVRSPRAMAFCILGADAMLAAGCEERRASQTLERFAVRLAACAGREARSGWIWFERVLAYDNCRLPEALLRAGLALDRPDFIRTGLETLYWIVGRQTAAEGYFRPIGNECFGREYCQPSPWDQQPLEAQATIDACQAAFAATNDTHWLDVASRAYAWFHGHNDGGIAIGDPATGECYDGLTPAGANLNRGAESVLAFQLASCAMAGLPDRGAVS